LAGVRFIGIILWEGGYFLTTMYPVQSINIRLLHIVVRRYYYFFLLSFITPHGQHKNIKSHHKRSGKVLEYRMCYRVNTIV